MVQNTFSESSYWLASDARTKTAISNLCFYFYRGYWVHNRRPHFGFLALMWKVSRLAHWPSRQFIDSNRVAVLWHIKNFKVFDDAVGPIVSWQ
jgi:hypothetical protein